METGEIYAEAGDELDAVSIKVLEEQGFTTVDVLDIDHVTVGPYMRSTLRIDKIQPAKTPCLIFTVLCAQVSHRP